jgi:hypothetical protein
LIPLLRPPLYPTQPSIALRPLGHPLSPSPPFPNSPSTPIKGEQHPWPSPHLLLSLLSSPLPSSAYTTSSSCRRSSPPSHHIFAAARAPVSPLPVSPRPPHPPRLSQMSPVHRALVHAAMRSIVDLSHAARFTHRGLGPPVFPLENKSGKMLFLTVLHFSTCSCCKSTRNPQAPENLVVMPFLFEN